jgi:hypothetical protein
MSRGADHVTISVTEIYLVKGPVVGSGYIVRCRHTGERWVVSEKVFNKLKEHMRLYYGGCKKIGGKDGE